MAVEKPTAAFVLSLIGGIFLLLGGIIQGTILLAFSFFSSGLAGLAAVSYVVGVLVVLGAVMLYIKPEQKIIWGSIIIVFSVLGFVFNLLGGFVIGSILGIVGGALGLAFKPAAERTCPRCGRQVSLEFNVCPHCGYTFPTAPPVYAAPPSPPAQP